MNYTLMRKECLKESMQDLFCTYYWNLVQFQFLVFGSTSDSFTTLWSTRYALSFHPLFVHVHILACIKSSSPAFGIQQFFHHCSSPSIVETRCPRKLCALTELFWWCMLLAHYVYSKASLTRNEAVIRIDSSTMFHIPCMGHAMGCHFSQDPPGHTLTYTSTGSCIGGVQEHALISAKQQERQAQIWTAAVV